MRVWIIILIITKNKNGTKSKANRLTDKRKLKLKENIFINSFHNI
jgi:hypothetical protein